MDLVPYLAAASALAALVLAFYFYRMVEAESPGDERMVFLMNEIRTGAQAFLKKEYTWVAVFVVAMMVLLAVVINPLAAVTYLLGALLSAGAGWVGMNVATIANARTAEAAKSGPGKALPVAFRGGAVMGFSVAGLALFGLALTYLVFIVWMEVDEAFEIFTAYGLGASSIALFSRVGGGIYTKAADVGADLVGKVEAGHPRRRPPQPGHHRRQRGRQRRRRRRHGRRPVRVVRRLDHRSGLADRVRAGDHRRPGRRRLRALAADVPVRHRLHRHGGVDHRLVLREGRRLDRESRAEPRAPHGHQRGHGDHGAGQRRGGLLVVLRQRLLRQPDRAGDLGHRRPDRRLGARQVRRVLHERPVRPGQEDRQAVRDRTGDHDPRRHQHRHGVGGARRWC